MANSKYVEYALGRIKDIISANLDAKLTAIEAEIGDGLDLMRPRATSYYINEIEELDNLPAIVILPDTANIAIPGLTWDDTEYNIIVSGHVFSTSGKIDQCAKRAYRYARAIRELIIEYRTLSDTVVAWYATGVNYGVMMEDGNGFMQSIEINTVVKVQECTI